MPLPPAQLTALRTNFLYYESAGPCGSPWRSGRRCRGLRSPVDALSLEPFTVVTAKIYVTCAFHGGRCHFHAACASDVSDPFVAAVEHDLLESRHPAEQQ